MLLVKLLSVYEILAVIGGGSSREVILDPL
jgi:hypothetical protein